MNSLSEIIGVANRGFSWIMRLTDYSIKGALILAAAILITTFFKKRSSSEFRYVIIFIAICGAVVLPFLFQIANYLKPSYLLQPVIEAAEPIRGTGILKGTEFEGVYVIDDSKPSDEYQPQKGSSSWVIYFLYIWVAGFVFFIARLIFGILAISKIANKSIGISNPSHIKTFAVLKSKIGIKRPIKVLLSPYSIPPITYGTIQPIIILPLEADYWSEEQFRVVVLHELIHINRFDNIIQIISQFTCALYWFNPLVWSAAAILKEEREESCDDRVLRFGVKSYTYAECLLEAVKAYSIPRLLKVTTNHMADISNSEKRIRSILDTGRRRNTLSVRLVVSCVLTALILILPISLVSVVAAKDSVKITFNTDSTVNIINSQMQSNIYSAKISDVPTLWPVKVIDGVVSSRFGSITSNAKNKQTINMGIDIQDGSMWPSVLATADGKVLEVGCDKERGFYVLIEHKSGLKTYYCYLEKVSVMTGSSVQKGKIIGQPGKAGLVHYEVWWGNTPVDPVPFVLNLNP
ncbi:MAG: M23/M56 family metallopeptidase [Clostridia bacterium]|nr:M23/M56 family metallopeptidase [Clostridia bacterium]